MRLDHTTQIQTTIIPVIFNKVCYYQHDFSIYTRAPIFNITVQPVLPYKSEDRKTN